MIKLGYELKIKDIFVPNGTPPEVLSIMKSIDNPSDVFAKGCFIEQLGLQTPVYPQIHILDSYDYKNIGYDEALVNDIQDEFYYYPIAPFGTANGFIGVSKKNQINYNFTNSISKKVLTDIQNGNCKILIDKVSEGHPFCEDWIEQLHELLYEKNIPKDKVIYATSNLRFLDDYKKRHDDRIEIIHSNHNELEIILTYDFVGGWNNKTDVKRNKHFISLNHSNKIHRTSLVNNLLKNNYSDIGHFSYVSKGIFLDIKDYEDREGDNDVLTKWFIGLNDLYADSYWNFTTETLFEDPAIRFSEKIFKPILYQQPFLLYGTPHMLKKFKNLGYKTFSKWIDESYDDELNHTKRLVKLNEQVNYICSLKLSEIHEMYIEMKDILNHNYNHLFALKDRIVLPL